MVHGTRLFLAETSGAPCVVRKALMVTVEVDPARVESPTSITKSARDTPSVHHVRMPAKRWMLARHGEWAVDVVSGRDHREVRQGVCEGIEGGKGQILDQVVEVTGWSRDNARRRLTAAARPPGAGREVAKRFRRQRNPKYSYDALKVLQKVWAASGGQCGRYLVASMALQLDALERHGELVPDQDRYSSEVRAELLAMSSAKIDRLPARRQGPRPIKEVSDRLCRSGKGKDLGA